MVQDFKNEVIEQVNALNADDIPSDGISIGQLLELYQVVKKFKREPLHIYTKAMNEAMINLLDFNDDNPEDGFRFTPPYIATNSYHLSEISNFISETTSIID